MKDNLRSFFSAYHHRVTGSTIMFTIKRPDEVKYNILIEDGYFQEKDYCYLNYVNDFNPKKLDSVIITHSHLDHIGRVPKLVKDGYNGPIYMTEYAKQIGLKILDNCAEQQKNNVEEMKLAYPDEEELFEELYDQVDVSNSAHYMVTVPYLKTVEILPGVEITFLENGHLLGAAMVLIQCHYEGMKSINYFFTGDYKLENCFFEVPEIPKYVREMQLIMVHESTYGNIDSKDIKKCFTNNMLEAFEKRMNILIGAFAQGRMQEMLYEMRLFQDAGCIPEEYIICVDGTLGIDITMEYMKILSVYSPDKADFLPKGLVFLDKKNRRKILELGGPKLIITTSGMLSSGPAQIYVPYFLKMENSMIHLVGYAAEGTLARKLLDTKHEAEVEIAGEKIVKRAIVKSTREKSSHPTSDDMIKFINSFENIQFLAINHGSDEAQEALLERVKQEAPKVKNVGRLNRGGVMYEIDQCASIDEEDKIIIKSKPNNLFMPEPPLEVDKVTRLIAKEKAKKAAKRKLEADVASGKKPQGTPMTKQELKRKKRQEEKAEKKRLRNANRGGKKARKKKERTSTQKSH